MSASGVLLDNGGIVVSSANAYEGKPAVGFDGTNYVIAWQDRRNESMSQDDIYAARITPGGALLDPSGIPVCTVSGPQKTPGLACSASQCLIAWEDGRSAGPMDIYGARTDSTGTVLQPNGVALSTALSDQLRPSVATTGNGYLVVWSDNRNPSGPGVYGTRVTSSGQVQDPAGLAIQPFVAPAQSSHSPSVTSSGSGYLVVWLNPQSHVKAQRLDGTTAQPIDATPITVCQTANTRAQLVASYGGGHYLVAWRQNALSTTQIAATWIDATSGVPFNPLAETTISDNTQGHSMPAVAWNGTGFLFAYHGPNHVRASIATAPGTPVSSSFLVSTVANAQQGPSVDWDGNRWLIAWVDYRGSSGSDLYAVRVDAQGQVLDPLGIVIGGQPDGETTISHDANHFVVFWQDWRMGVGDRDIYGVRIDKTSGAVLDPDGLPICTAFGYQLSVDAVFDGTNHLVVWQDTRVPGSGIYGARVQPSTGLPIEPAGFMIANSNAGPTEHPSVAFDGSNSLVVYSQSASSYNVRGVRVSPSAVVLDTTPINISAFAPPEWQPSVAFGDQAYFVVWSDSRTTWESIFGARVDGSVIDPTGILVVRPPLRGR